jgi:7-cyano-7-deazaguanine synthase
MKYFAGYTFGWPGCWRGYRPFVHGAVVTPRYAKRLARERLNRGDDSAIILDNGAWPAYQKGETLSVEDQLDAMYEAERELGALAWIVMPDVVGDSVASEAAFSEAIGLSGDRWPGKMRLRVVQDGANLDEMIACIQKGEAGGLFVGGKDKAWKLATACQLARSGIYVHVGRIASETELAICAEAGVSSFDNTTFMRRQHCNVAVDYGIRLAQSCERNERNMKSKAKTVLLCSGGIDSVVLSDWLLARGGYGEVVHYFVDYGQPVAAQERKAAMCQAHRTGQEFIEDRLPLRGVRFESEGASYIPNRNAILVSMAANLARSIGAGSVHYGATAEDYESYPDCRPGYVSLLSHLTASGAGVVVKTPFVSSSRDQILKLGSNLGSNLEATWSCYVGEESQCGECASCLQGES